MSTTLPTHSQNETTNSKLQMLIKGQRAVKMSASRSTHAPPVAHDALRAELAKVSVFYQVLYLVCRFAKLVSFLVQLVVIKRYQKPFIAINYDQLFTN